MLCKRFHPARADRVHKFGTRDLVEGMYIILGIF